MYEEPMERYSHKLSWQKEQYKQANTYRGWDTEVAEYQYVVRSQQERLSFVQVKLASGGASAYENCTPNTAWQFHTSMYDQLRAIELLK